MNLPYSPCRCKNDFTILPWRRRSLSPPHPGPGDLEKSEPDFPGGAGSVQKHIRVQSKSPFQSDFGKLC
jgi:hypothetical protein